MPVSARVHDVLLLVQGVEGPGGMASRDNTLRPSVALHPSGGFVYILSRKWGLVKIGTGYSDHPTEDCDLPLRGLRWCSDGELDLSHTVLGRTYLQRLEMAIHAGGHLVCVPAASRCSVDQQFELLIRSPLLAEDQLLRVSCSTLEVLPGLVQLESSDLAGASPHSWTAEFELADGRWEDVSSLAHIYPPHSASGNSCSQITSTEVHAAEPSGSLHAGQQSLAEQLRQVLLADWHFGQRVRLRCSHGSPPAANAAIFLGSSVRDALVSKLATLLRHSEPVPSGAAAAPGTELDAGRIIAGVDRLTQAIDSAAQAASQAGDVETHSLLVGAMQRLRQVASETVLRHSDMRARAASDTTTITTTSAAVPAISSSISSAAAGVAGFAAASAPPPFSTALYAGQVTDVSSPQSELGMATARSLAHVQPPSAVTASSVGLSAVSGMRPGIQAHVPTGSAVAAPAVPNTAIPSSVVAAPSSIADTPTRPAYSAAASAPSAVGIASLSSAADSGLSALLHWSDINNLFPSKLPAVPLRQHFHDILLGFDGFVLNPSSSCPTRLRLRCSRKVCPDPLCITLMSVH